MKSTTQGLQSPGHKRSMWIQDVYGSDGTCSGLVLLEHRPGTDGVAWVMGSEVKRPKTTGCITDDVSKCIKKIYVASMESSLSCAYQANFWPAFQFRFKCMLNYNGLSLISI